METQSANLAKWIVGGLAAGAVVIGIAVAAYAVGYHRGEHHHRAAGATTTAATIATSTRKAVTAGTTAATTVTVTPALVSLGKKLYTSDGCSACHSLTGAAGAGPSLEGLAGSTVSLDNGQTVTADAAYLEQSITDPDARVVKGYHSGIMAPAITGFGLAGKPDEVRALVAFIESQK